LQILTSKGFKKLTALKYIIISGTQTKIGLRCGVDFWWVYPIKPAEFLGRVPECHNPDSPSHPAVIEDGPL